MIASRRRLIGLIGGPVLAGTVLLCLPETYTAIDGSEVSLELPARATLALMVWMAIWWITEAVNVSVTALLPLVVLPLCTAGAFDKPSGAMRAAAAPYADPFIALFFGGFMMALAMERWNLHRRIALTTLRIVGTRPRAMVAGFMGIAAVLSMWVSNTATAVMMVPIATSVIGVAGNDDARQRNFALCLLLGIAYGASIGGIGTLIGTPPNLLLAGFLEQEYGRSISFGQWMLVGVPLVIVFAPIAWALLTWIIFPVSKEPIAGGRELVDSSKRALGRPGRGEQVAFIVFIVTALAWLTRRWLVELPGLSGLTDAGIAMTAAILLFAIPVRLSPWEPTLDWATARRAPWGVLILFGGGLSLAAAVKTHGVSDLIGAQAALLGTMPTWIIVIAVVAGVIFLTELTSNTATTAALLPILAAAAPALGVDPLALLVPAAIAASCAFMMPVATPPNAVIFGTGQVTIPIMCRAGLLLNLIGIGLITLMAFTIIGLVLGGSTA